jgi:hypothetical protein
MTVEIKERYGRMLTLYCSALKCRLRLLVGLSLAYAAFAAVFLWTRSAAKPFSLASVFFWMCFTALFWFADHCHRSALRQSMKVGIAVERDASAGIPEDQRFFSRLEERSLYDIALDVLTGILMFILSITGILLFLSGDKIP